MTGYCLPGSAALPEFRLGKTLARLRRELPAVTGVAAWAAYFVDAAAPLREEELAALGRLLDASPPARASGPSSGADPHPFTTKTGGKSGSAVSRAGAGVSRSPPGRARALVLPRAGTISPWSSKATDIVRNCGFDRVKRVERGVLWVISAPEGIPEQALGALYDRMTERLSLLSDPVVSGPRPAAAGEPSRFPRTSSAAPRPVGSAGSPCGASRNAPFTKRIGGSDSRSTRRKSAGSANGSAHSAATRPTRSS